MRFVRACILLLLSFTVTLWGAGPGEEYVRIYSLIQQGETLERRDQDAEALAAYLEAEKGLSRLQKASPGWNTKVVDYRLRYLQTKIAGLKPEASVQSTASAVDSSSSTTASTTSRPEVGSTEMAEMRSELQQLRIENSSLQAKLREALAIRPAEVDPKELKAAQDNNVELLKQIEVLKANLAETQKAITNQSELESSRQQAGELAAEVAVLNSKVASLQAAAESSDTLRQENERLRKELGQLRSQNALVVNAEVQQKLDETLTELALLRSESDILRLEKAALENRVQEFRTQIKSSPAPQVRTTSAEELQRLRTRLAVYEAEKSPYSAEELVLMRMGQANPVSGANRPQPPAGAGRLVAEAETAFKQGQFQEAERVLKEILATDETNAFTLSNLAATQMEQGRDEEAEANLRKALASSPRDPFTLATMGILQFRAENYEDALDYLGLAAQCDPNDAVVQNYLGMTLSERGMRGPAETALRRAIQLNPQFSDAHYNLALVYILQDPPMRELARWHYQKALGLGHPRSTELEQLLDQRGSE